MTQKILALASMAPLYSQPTSMMGWESYLSSLDGKFKVLIDLSVDEVGDNMNLVEFQTGWQFTMTDDDNDNYSIYI